MLRVGKGDWMSVRRWMGQNEDIRSEGEGLKGEGEGRWSEERGLVIGNFRRYERTMTWWVG